MLSIDKLLGLAGMGSAIANVSLLKRFLSGVAVVVAFTALSGTMVGMLLIAALYALYLSLIRHGLDPLAAALMAGGLALLIVVGVSAFAVWRWYQLREMPRLLYLEAPIVNRAHKLAEAFITGLLAERRRER